MSEVTHIQRSRNFHLPRPSPCDLKSVLQPPTLINCSDTMAGRDHSEANEALIESTNIGTEGICNWPVETSQPWLAVGFLPRLPLIPYLSFKGGSTSRGLSLVHTSSTCIEPNLGITPYSMYILPLCLRYLTSVPGRNPLKSEDMPASFGKPHPTGTSIKICDQRSAISVSL